MHEMYASAGAGARGSNGGEVIVGATRCRTTAENGSRSMERARALIF